jgi:hypothetical protein
MSAQFVLVLARVPQAVFYDRGFQNPATIAIGKAAFRLPKSFYE